MMIDYKKAEQAKELLQECGASFIIAYKTAITMMLFVHQVIILSLKA